LKENWYTGQTASSFREFSEILKTIDITSLEFHVQRGDFENWVKEVFNDEELASEITELRIKKVNGELLRNRICEIVGRNNKMLNLLL